jgi:hypothetical protein
MGSAAEFNAMCKFLTEKKIELSGLVDSVFKGLESADEAFEKMKNGSQFGNSYCLGVTYFRETSDNSVKRRQWQALDL